MGLAAGKTPDALRAELKTVGWADADIEAVFGALAATSVRTEPKSKTTSLISWKPIVIAIGAVVIVGAAAAVFLFLRNSKINSSPGLANTPPENTPAVNATADSSGGTAKDDAKINDLDLMVYSSNLPAAQNAYFDEDTLQGVTDKSDVSPNGDILRQLSGADPWDQAFVDDIVNKNGLFITNFADAVKRPGFQVPEYSDPRSFGSAASEIKYDQLGRLTEIMALEGLSSAKKGDVPDGAAEALAVALYGQKMADSQIDANGYLVGLSIKKTGLETLMKILAFAKPSSDLAGQLDGSLAAFDNTSSSLAISFKISYWIDRNKLTDIINDPARYNPYPALNIAPEKFNDLYFLEPNKTINLMGDDVRAAVALAVGPCREFSDPVMSDADLAALQKMDTENGFGKLYASKLQTGWAAPLNARCADTILVASTRAALVPLVKGK